MIMYPNNHDNSAASLSAVLKVIRTTPTGGASPAAPQASVTTASTSIIDAGAHSVDFTVGFFADGRSATPTGFDAADLTLAGSTATGASIASITPSGSGYTVRVGPLTGSGTVTALTTLPAGLTLSPSGVLSGTPAAGTGECTH